MSKYTADIDLIWTCKDGTEVKICEMTDSHLKNCIAYIERESVEVPYGSLHDINSFDVNVVPMTEYFEEEYEAMKLVVTLRKIKKMEDGK